MKVCNQCGDPKPLSEYYKCPTTIDGLRGQCKQCMSEHRKTHYAANKDAHAARCRDYARRNPEKIRTDSARYYQEHRAESKIQGQRYREENPDRVKAYKDKWLRNNPERRKETSLRYALKNREKKRACKILQMAIDSGAVERPRRCSDCDIESVPHGHHQDYTKPLRVIWLCPKCHGAIHTRIREDLTIMDVGLDAA